MSLRSAIEWGKNWRVSTKALIEWLVASDLSLTPYYSSRRVRGLRG
jgi:hypothetical protein